MVAALETAGVKKAKPPKALTEKGVLLDVFQSLFIKATLGWIPFIFATILGHILTGTSKTIRVIVVPSVLSVPIVHHCEKHLLPYSLKALPRDRPCKFTFTRRPSSSSPLHRSSWRHVVQRSR